MKRYIAKRLLMLIPILLGVTFLTFALMNLAGGDAVSAVYERAGAAVSEEVMEAQRARLGLDDPFLVRYFRWLAGFLTGNMGVSYISGKDVFQTFVSKLPATLLLTAVSMAVTAAVSLPLGILAAVRHNRFVDGFIRVISLIGNSMPNFFVALVLMYIFAIRLGIFPVMATGVNGTSVVLPAATLGISMSSKYIRQVRAVVLDELGKSYVAGARTRGVRERVILWENVLRVSMTTMLTLFALSVGSLLGGTAIVENIFLWDGVGKLAVDSINMRDDPMILAYVAWMSVIYVAVNLVTDLLYHVLDPRIRMKDRTILPLRERKTFRFARTNRRFQISRSTEGAGSEAENRKETKKSDVEIPTKISVRKCRVRRNHIRRSIIVSGCLVCALILSAAFARYLCPYDPTAQNLAESFQAPSAAHLLGTDQFGRDMLSRVIMGSQASVLSSLLLVVTILAVGTAVGSVAGFCGGAADSVIMRISDVFLSFPELVFALAIAGVLGGGTMNAVLALALISWPKYARLARSQVLSQKKELYTDAARMAGDSGFQIFFRHLFPNIMGLLLVTAVSDIGAMMMSLAGLSFLGLGTMPPTPEWGTMMSEARGFLQTVPWVTLAPGAGMFLAVLIFQLFGDALRDRLNPELR